MADQDKVIEIIRRKGPVIPADIAKEISLDLLFASAVLSELTSKGKLKISSVKVGGSPLYYLPDQEAMLQNFASRLGEKDKHTYDLLKQDKIIRDSEAEPLTRVSLRQIKDFAKPLRVKTENGEELFWKWYVLTKEETSTIIRKMLGIKESVPEKKETPTPVEPKQKPVQEETSKTTNVAPSKEPIKLPEEEKTPKEIKKKESPTSEQQSLSRTVELPKDQFSNTIMTYFSSNKIDVLDTTINRKGSDMEFLLKVPSAAGSLRFFCKAKSKKRINDGDLSSAFVQGQTKKLPVLYLATGELTKKAKAMLEKEFEGMAFKRI